MLTKYTQKRQIQQRDVKRLGDPGRASGYGGTGLWLWWVEGVFPGARNTGFHDPTTHHRRTQNVGTIRL